MTNASGFRSRVDFNFFFAVDWMHQKHVTLKEQVCGWNMWKTNVKHTFIAVILSVGRWGANLLENQTLRVFLLFQILGHW